MPRKRETSKPRRRKTLGKQGLKCPRCKKHGSGPHPKWVLNEQHRRYEPYYYVAHFSMNEGHRKISWCYIPKKQALKILARRKAKKRRQRSR